MKTQFELHGLVQTVILVYLHVNPFRVVKLKETSILMHLQIISAKSDNITDHKFKFLYVRRIFRKEKHIFSQLAFVYILSGQAS